MQKTIEITKENPKEEIVHKKDLLSEYDVIEGLVKNEQGRLLKDILKDVKDILESDYAFNLNYFDYFSVNTHDRQDFFPVTFQRIIIYCVPGNSEGWYTHVDVSFSSEKERYPIIKNFFLAKDLSGKPDNSLRLVEALTKIFYK